MKRYWWDSLELCRGRNKDGSYCNNSVRRPYDIGVGNLFIPLTCWRHKDQENELRKNQNET